MSVFDLKIFYLALLQARKVHDVKINTAVSAVSAPPFPLQRKLNEKCGVRGVKTWKWSLVGMSPCSAGQSGRGEVAEKGRHGPMGRWKKWGPWAVSGGLSSLSPGFCKDCNSQRRRWRICCIYIYL